MKYVVCVPDGCADEPVADLGGRTPLEVASMPTLAGLARRGEVGRAAVIPPGLPPGSDVGNMAILGYDPARFHTGRAPIEAAALGLRLRPDQVAYRCNLVTVGDDGTMLDFAGGHPTSEAAAEVIEALDGELGGDIAFHPGVQYRHIVVAPQEWADADCTPPHDLSDKPAVWPTGPAAPKLQAVMDASRGRSCRRSTRWPPTRCGCGARARSRRCRRSASSTACRRAGHRRRPRPRPRRAHRHGRRRGRGRHRLVRHQLRGQARRRPRALADGADLFVIHVEATDEAGHAGNVEEKVRALENWDRRILAGLVDGLDALGPWRLLLLPDHATPLQLKTHTSDPVPYLLVGDGIDGSPAAPTPSRRRRPSRRPRPRALPRLVSRLDQKNFPGRAGPADGSASSAVTSEGLNPTSHHVGADISERATVAPAGPSTATSKPGGVGAHGVDELGQLLGLSTAPGSKPCHRAARRSGARLASVPHPHRRVGPLHRRRPEAQAVDGEGVAAVVDLVARPRRHAHLQALVEQRRPAEPGPSPRRGRTARARGRPRGRRRT